jgi:crotonobetainyl-CoA:carnitine CoA-transferase CaiB-like acyl-CoA transferase
MPGPLHDLLILDLSRVLAGPYCTMLLGDLGARVIKVEQPGKGDDTRQWGPPFTANGESAYFLCANRNKESITVDLRHPQGQALIRALAQRADVLVENFKVDGLKPYQLDYAALSALNPALIYCSITGYGQTGPYRERPGYDSVIQAQGGIMSITGPVGEDGEPYKVGVAIADITTGLHAAIAILAALHHRQQSGLGQSIDIALFDTQLSWLANVASAYLVSGAAPKRFGNAHATIVPYQSIRTADGFISLAVGNDGQYRALCSVLGCVELAHDVRFASNPARVQHRQRLIPLLEERFQTNNSDYWIEALLNAGVPCAPVNDIPTALNDPQTIARQMVQHVEHPVSGLVPLLGPVAKLSATPAAIYTAPPLLGEHTERVLAEILGYSAEAIDELRRAGAV